MLGESQRFQGNRSPLVTFSNANALPFSVGKLSETSAPKDITFRIEVTSALPTGSSTSLYNRSELKTTRPEELRYATKSPRGPAFTIRLNGDTSLLCSDMLQLQKLMVVLVSCTFECAMCSKAILSQSVSKIDVRSGMLFNAVCLNVVTAVTQQLSHRCIAFPELRTRTMCMLKE